MVYIFNIKTVFYKCSSSKLKIENLVKLAFGLWVLVLIFLKNNNSFCNTGSTAPISYPIRKPLVCPVAVSMMESVTVVMGVMNGQGKLRQNGWDTKVKYTVQIDSLPSTLPIPYSMPNAQSKTFDCKTTLYRNDQFEQSQI